MKKIEILKDLDLSKRFPGYVRKYIFRIAIILVIALSMLDIYIAGGIYSPSVSCPANSNESCLNPFYKCETFYEATNEICNIEVPDYYCKYDICHKKYIYPGEYFGRKDILHKYGFEILAFIVICAFVINHVLYKLRGKYNGQ